MGCMGPITGELRLQPISNYAKSESYGQQGEFFDASEYECQ